MQYLHIITTNITSLLSITINTNHQAANTTTQPTIPITTMEHHSLHLYSPTIYKHAISPTIRISLCQYHSSFDMILALRTVLLRPTKYTPNPISQIRYMEIYTRLHIQTYATPYLAICMCIIFIYSIYAHIHLYIAHVPIRTHIVNTYIHTLTYTPILKDTCVCVYIYIHIYIYTNLYLHKPSTHIPLYSHNHTLPYTPYTHCCGYANTTSRFL